MPHNFADAVNPAAGDDESAAAALNARITSAAMMFVKSRLSDLQQTYTSALADVLQQTYTSALADVAAEWFRGGYMAGRRDALREVEENDPGFVEEDLY